MTAPTHPAWITLSLHLALCSAGVGTAWWSWQLLLSERQKLAAEIVELQQQRKELERIKTDSSSLQQTGARFLKLKDQGFFVAENRLDWVDQLNLTRTHLAIPHIHYEFQPLRPLNASTGRLMVSSMVLELGLNHEMELPAFLESLAHQNQALILARECELKPELQRSAPPAPGPNIAAQCKIDWVTGRLPGDRLP